MKNGVHIKTRSIRKIVMSIILMVLAVALSISTIRLIGKYQRARDLYQSTLRKHQELTELRNQLQESVSELSDEQGVDRELRQKLRVVEEGEELIIIIPEEELR